MIRSSIGHQRGSTLVGFIAGLVVGLASRSRCAFHHQRAGAVRQQGTAGQRKRESRRRRPVARSEQAAVQAPPAKPMSRRSAAKIDAATDPKAAPPPAEKGERLARDEDTRFLLQAGAFRTPEDADAMRARLALLGFDARVFPREQDGTTLVSRAARAIRQPRGCQPHSQNDDGKRHRRSVRSKSAEGGSPVGATYPD